jgi:DNA-binding transcriptional MerR regulator
VDGVEAADAAGQHHGTRAGSGYRLYSEHALQTLEIITQAQLGGFTLAEIKKLLPADDLGNWNREELLPALRRKIAALDERRAADAKRQIADVIDAIEAKPEPESCADSAARILKQVGSASR